MLQSWAIKDTKTLNASHEISHIPELPTYMGDSHIPELPTYMGDSDEIDLYIKYPILVHYHPEPRPFRALCALKTCSKWRLGSKC
jgi:hypothetical protein